MIAVLFKRSNDRCKELSQANGYLRTTITEQAARIAQLERNMSELAPERISIQKQAWLEADRQYQINEQAARTKALEGALRQAKESLSDLAFWDNGKPEFESVHLVIAAINELIGE